MKEESESYYDNIRTYHPDAATRWETELEIKQGHFEAHSVLI